MASTTVTVPGSCTAPVSFVARAAGRAMHLFIAVGLVLVAGCGPDDPVLATVGDTEITESQLERFVDLLPVRLQSENQGVAADREHLDSMIDREMLLLEARARGLDTSAVVTRQMKLAQQQYFTDRYRRQVIDPKIDVTPEDIERGFRDMGFDRERLLSRILVKGTQQDAVAVLEQLEAGTPFADLAREYSGNDPSADETGKIGWIGLTGLKPFLIQAQTFRALAINKPRLIRLGPTTWQIVRFEEDREAQLQTYRDDVLSLLTMEHRWRHTEEEVELLRRTYGARYHPEAAQAQIRRVEERRQDFTPEEAKLPLYTFANGDSILAAEFLTRIREVKGSAAVSDSARIVDMLAVKELLHPYLFNREASALGWDEEEQFLDWRTHTHTGLLLEHQMNTQVESQLDLSEDNLRSYYEDNRGDFAVGETVHIEEVHVKDESAARQIRDDIAQGASFAEVLGRAGVASHGKNRRGGKMTLQSHLAGRFPELVEAAFAAPVGELVGPLYLEAPDSYGVLRVIERQEPRVRSFEEARKQVKHLQRVEQTEKLVTAFMLSVQDKYKDRVRVFDDRLEKRHRDR
jgi:parvulin-like peptidyl-prolyl isomerase